MRKSTVIRQTTAPPMPRQPPHADTRPQHHREFPVGYSSAGCSPAEPASASPTPGNIHHSSTPAYRCCICWLTCSQFSCLTHGVQSTLLAGNLKWETGSDQDCVVSQPPGSLRRNFRPSEKWRHFRGLAGNGRVFGEENRALPTEGGVFLDESLPHEFSISGIGRWCDQRPVAFWQRRGSKVAWLDISLVKVGIVGHAPGTL